jgi:hypothetical protein
MPELTETPLSRVLQKWTTGWRSNENLLLKTNDQFPGVRLAVAGFSTLLLLLWIAIAKPFPSYVPMHPVTLLVTTAIALFILVIVAPVVRHGPGNNRWLALLIAIFPVLVLLALFKPR